MKKYFIILSLFFAITVSAHGLATSKQQISGNYLMEFEYNTIGNVLTGDYQLYNFDILDAKSLKFVNFARAYVKFSMKNAGVVEVADLYPTETLGAGLPSARLGTVFTDAGDYTLDVIYYDAAGAQISSTTYDFTVDSRGSAVKSGATNVPLDIVLVTLGIILGFGINRLRTKV